MWFIGERATKAVVPALQISTATHNFHNLKITRLVDTEIILLVERLIAMNAKHHQPSAWRGGLPLSFSLGGLGPVSGQWGEFAAPFINLCTCSLARKLDS